MVPMLFSLVACKAVSPHEPSGGGRAVKRAWMEPAYRHHCRTGSASKIFYAAWTPHMPYDDLEFDPPMSSRAKGITAVVVVGILLLIVVAVLM